MAILTDYTLSSFSANIKGLARPNRFVFSYQGEDWSTYQCTKVSIPKLDIKGPEIKWRGTSFTLPGDPKKEPLTVSFLNDSKWTARSYFETKMNSIREHGSLTNDTSGYTNVGTPINDVIFKNANAIIEQIDNKNKVIARYTFSHCIPLEMSEITLDSSAASTFETFDVVFHYGNYAQTITEYG